VKSGVSVVCLFALCYENFAFRARALAPETVEPEAVIVSLDGDRRINSVRVFLRGATIFSRFW